QWNAAFSRYAKDFPEEAKELRRRISGDLPAGWEKALPRFSKPEAKATRAYSGEVINAIAGAVPDLFGGSADLTPSNNT
ncbi:transketolase, partial [Escherichia coli]|nr:transketolase [Escherichia coli]